LQLTVCGLALGGFKNRQTFYNHKIKIKIQNIFFLLFKINFLLLADKIKQKNYCQTRLTPLAAVS